MTGGVMTREAKTLREWRDALGETQQQFATRLDVSISAVVSWERGVVPRTRMKQRIAERLKLRPEQIVWPEDEKEG